MRRISEIKEEVSVTRPARDSKGNLVYKKLYFNNPYDPGIQGNQFIRLIAKIIDVIPIMCFLLLMRRFSLSELIVYSILISIIINSFLEHYSGTTLGKLICELKVIDDFGNYPKLSKSLARNLLAILCLVPVYYGGNPNSLNPFKYPRFGLNIFYNNKKCKTYIVWNDNLEEIRKKQME